MKFILFAFRVLLLASFAVWFGGFFFYVSFVVPIGNEVLGSTFEQGMITRRATVPLNWLSVLAGSLMVADSIFTWRSKGRIRWIQIVFPIILLAMVAWLFTLHPQIDAFVDADTRQIGGDYDQFYWLCLLYTSPSPRDRTRSRMPSSA